MTNNPHRLPRYAVPRHYDLEIEPDLQAFTFAGRVRVDLSLAEPRQDLVLNAIELELGDVFLTSGAERIPATVEYDPELERVTLGFPETASAGDWTLEASFTGTINDQLRGFYRSTFTDVDGNQQVIATTQFEATDARRAFPCWDEPDFKATFGVTLVVPEDLFAVSNSPEVERAPLGDGRVRIRYADTMKMSTYLVAFVVGPLEATEPVDVDGVPLRVIAPLGKGHLTRFALDAGAACLRHLTGYYGIPYPGDKIDFIALPDFAFGAMENLGAITYRETSLLIDPTATGQAEQRRVVDVIAHELAHMWFGDLVTMGWWEGIWLNEAFASFMEMKTVDALHPEWRRWLAFAADGGSERAEALATDALTTTRPVEFPVQSPEEANEMFDALTYGKGSAILRMMEQFLGEETFRKGVERYLREHAYGNTVTADLWRALDAASDRPVGEIMDTWILQGGFPQVDADVVDGALRLRQRRYLLSGDTNEQLWTIPLQIRSQDHDAVTRTLMREAEMSVPAGDGWTVVNAGGHGFYRVRYAQELLDRLVVALPELERMERFTVLDDTFAFVANGQLTTEDFLTLADAYHQETEQAVWQMLIGHLARIHHITEDPWLTGFQRRLQALVGPALDRLGWDPHPGESDLDRLLRGQLIRAMGMLGGHGPTIERAAEAADAFIDEPETVDPDVGQAGVFVTAAQSDMEWFHRIWKAHETASTPQREIRFLQALTEFDAAPAVDEMFARILDGRIRNQDSAWVIMRMLSLRHQGGYVWQQVRAHWDDLLRSIPALTVKYLLDGIPALDRPKLARDVEAFLAEHPVEVAEKTQAQNLERLRAGVAMRVREADTLERLFGS